MPCYDDRDRQDLIQLRISAELLTVLLCGVNQQHHAATEVAAAGQSWCHLHRAVDEATTPHARDIAQQQLYRFERESLRRLERAGVVPKKYREGL